MTTVRSVGRFPTRDVPPMGWAGEARRRRDDDEEPETIEIHNHLPQFGREPDYGALTSEEMDSDRARHRDLRARRHRDDEYEDDEDGEVVARYPASYHVQTEGDEIVIYSKPPRSQPTDLLDFRVDDRRRKHVARDQRPPQSLAELNQLHRQFYAKSHAVR